MRIEAARATDSPAIVALLAQAGLPIADLTPAALAEFLVARDGGEVIGAVTVERHGDDGLLRSLVVAPAQRGHGLGRALVAAAEAQAQAAGLRALTLLTQSAAEFFAALGYRRTDRADASAALQASSQFASVCPASAACLRKSFSA